MKKFFVAALLVVTTLTNILPVGLNQVSNTAVVSAASTNLDKKTPMVSLSTRTAGSATLSITKLSGADGYKVYRSTSVDGTYQYIGYTKSSTYTDKTLSYNVKYYYKVRAYVDVNGKRINSKYSDRLTVLTSFSRPTGVTGIQNSSNSVKLQWNDVSNASKYKVYRSSTKTGSYKYIGMTSNNYYTDSTVKDGSTYYYVIRGYKNVNGSKYNGVYSKQFTITLKTNTTSTDQGSPSTGTYDSDFEKDYANQVLVLVNQERAKEGLSALSISEVLVAPANLRAKEIKKSFSHTRPDGREWSTVLADYSISVKYGGENLAYGYNTAVSVVEGWMNSTGHRANILNSNFNKIGIGVYVDSSGTVYATQLFTN